MNPAETATILRQFNEWRMGDEDLPQPDPKQITAAIYAAVDHLDRLEDAESAHHDDYQNWMMALDRNAGLLAKLEVAEKSDAESIAMYRKARDERDALRAELAQLHKEADKFGDGIDWIQRALQAEAQIEAMGQQKPVAWMSSRNGFICKENKNPDYNVPLYALPGAQPAPSVPREAVEKMLTQLMDIAVSNGANIISMPDEYVEVAAWLCGIPAQPAPSVPDGWKLMPIEPTTEMLGAGEDTFVPTYTGTPVSAPIDVYRAMLAAAPEPEAKP